MTGQYYPTVSGRIIRALLWIVSVAILFFLVSPLLAIVPLSLTSSAFMQYPIPSYSLRWYEDFLTNPDWISAFRNTFIIGTATAAIATTLGTLAALGLSRDGFPFKRLVTSFFILPIVMPAIVLAVATYFAFAPLGLTNSFTGVILAHTTLAVPFVVITVGAALSGFDQNLVRAATSLGATPLKTFFKVTLPLLFPGVMSGAVIAFATSLDEVVMILFLAGPDQNTIPRQMFNGIKYFISPTITAVATMLIMVSVLMLAAVGALRARASRHQTAAKENP
jgi:putative spermidine/putrescine transport system permease protein